MNIFLYIFIAIIVIALALAFKFWELFKNNLLVAFYVWMGVGAVSMFTDTYTFSTWLGLGVLCLLGAYGWLILQIFAVHFLGDGSEMEDKQVGLVVVHGAPTVFDGVVVEDDMNRIWNPGQILTPKAGQSTKRKWWQVASDGGIPVVNDVKWADWQTCKDIPTPHSHTYDENGKSVCGGRK